MRVGWSLAGLAVSVTGMLIVLSAGGGAPVAARPGLPDSGPIVGWGVPLLTVLTQVSAVIVIGFLLTAVFLLVSQRDVVQGLAVDAVMIARRAAWVWAIGSVVLLLFTTAEIFARPLTGLNWATVGALMGDPTGRGLWLQAVGAASLAILLRWTVSVRPLALLFGLAVATTAPVAFTGHSASSGSHTLAVISVFIHVVGISVWVGGLLALAWVASRGSKRLDSAIARYSTAALWSFVIVGASGTLNASVRLNSVGEVFSTPYGRVVLVKVALFGALGYVGWLHRRRIVARGQGFLRLALGEATLMAATIGVAVGVSRTPPPVGEVLVTPAEDLLGGAMPAAPTIERFITSWNGNGIGLVIVFLGTALYLRGVWLMRRRGDGWPIGRTVSWVIGMAVIGWATFGGLGTYSHVLFSAHMVSHMLLSMVAPIFLVLAAPVTLALRTLPGPRQPGEISPRALLTSLLHSRFARVVTHPLVGPALFIGSLYALYFTELFETLMVNHLGHVFMEIHFLAVGMLFYYVLIGIDPSPRHLPPLVRFGMLLVTLPFHAFFAIAVMSATTVFAEPYWTGIERPYRTDLLADQYLGGSIAWALGEVPLLLVMIALLVQWFKSDRRESARLDRAADRDDDAELKAYNERLRALAEHGRRRDP